MSDRAQIVSQKIAIDSLKKSIQNEIVESVTALQNAQLILKTLAHAPSGDQLRPLADADYQAGNIRKIDRSTVEDSLSDQEEIILQNKLAYSLAAAALDRALGRLVKIYPGEKNPS